MDLIDLRMISAADLTDANIDFFKENICTSFDRVVACKHFRSNYFDVSIKEEVEPSVFEIKNYERWSINRILTYLLYSKALYVTQDKEKAKILEEKLKKEKAKEEKARIFAMQNIIRRGAPAVEDSRYVLSFKIISRISKKHFFKLMQIAGSYNSNTKEGDVTKENEKKFNSLVLSINKESLKQHNSKHISFEDYCDDILDLYIGLMSDEEKAACYKSYKSWIGN